jgi:hypothetical protein
MGKTQGESWSTAAVNGESQTQSEGSKQAASKSFTLERGPVMEVTSNTARPQHFTFCRYSEYYVGNTLLEKIRGVISSGTKT